MKHCVTKFHVMLVHTHTHTSEHTRLRWYRCCWKVLWKLSSSESDQRSSSSDLSALVFFSFFFLWNKWKKTNVLCPSIHFTTSSCKSEICGGSSGNAVCWISEFLSTMEIWLWVLNSYLSTPQHHGWTNGIFHKKSPWQCSCPGTCYCSISVN